MAVSIQYKTLFKLDVLHHYFLSGGATNKEFGEMTNDEKAVQLKNYRLADFLEVIPDGPTLKSMKGLKQIYRTTANGFRVIASVDENDMPSIDIAEDTKWTFALLIKDSRFWNYSALRLEPGFDALDPNRNNLARLFYYSNTNSGITAPNISSDIPAFNGAATYQMNDIVSHAGNIYEAVEHNPPGATPVVANSGWQLINTQAFATHLDELRWRNTFFNYRFKSPDIWALFKLNNRNGETLYETYSQSSSKNMMYSIDMSPYRAGWYQLVVTGTGYADTQSFYYHQEFQSRPLFGIIEIFHQAALSAGFELLDGDGKVQEQSFELRFKNRLTQWRYKDSTDQTAIGSIDGIDNALPLTQTGFVSSVERNGKKLPNPNAKMIKTESDAIYSDVFIDSGQYPL